ncbi:MAG: hypothetical protein A2902_01120 [Elusimicrobia bacterium RIFCSPLOWO2_01_FULL_64_13]|nr:MAG: hypothetical protein A2636_03710 [Elusimicrobia bacterium RIFCSPHIGHO2_01_FULL_64_10]OGR97895.1 MAG: hypothetical protein A2902_01120 [Elusimicrobia bacterium RIFCSPLOWO2_01_FULL_64_13]
MAVKATRQSFGETVALLGETNPNIVVMDADLGKSTMTGGFQKKFPDRYLEMGIAEHNLIGTAAGLSLAGKIPFATSFSCFIAGRYETIRMSVAYPNANVKIVGTHAGVGIGEDGYSQMGLEDVALLRSLPNFTILQPADDLETRQAVEWAAAHSGPVYLRLTRQKVFDVHSPGYVFQAGKGDVLARTRPGKKPVVTVFATGGVVANAGRALEDLAGEPFGINLVNIHTLHPIDRELVVRLARESRAILTVEDHSVTGGLGSAVSEAVAGAGIGVRVVRHGLSGYGESGDPEGLYEKFGLSASGIKARILEAAK